MMKIKRNGFTLIELTVVIAIFLILTVILAPFVKMIKERAHIINCENNLRRISLGLHSYAADHNEVFPPDLASLYPNYVEKEDAFDCPATGAVGTPEKPDYKYTAGLTEPSAQKEIIVEDVENNHKRAGRNILRIGGSVEWVGRRR